MRLEDDAIVLRPLTEADAPALVAAIGDDPDLDRWTRIPFPYTEGHAREFIAATEEAAFAILDRASGELLGGIGARALDAAIVEIGYWVKAEARGRGVATLALELIVRFAFAELAPPASSCGPSLTTSPRSVSPRRPASPARASCARSWSSRAGAGTP